MKVFSEQNDAKSLPENCILSYHISNGWPYFKQLAIFKQFSGNYLITYFLLIMKSTPVICGIDLGSWSFKISAFNGQKFEVLTNQANFRQTPSLVGYTSTERLIGEAALIKLKTNFGNTIRAPQRMLGMERHQHLLEQQLKYQRVKYKAGEDLIFTVQGKHGDMNVSTEEVLLSLIGKAKSIIQNSSLSLSLCYIAVPTYIGQEERATLKKCAQISLNKPVRLIDDWVALGCQYTYSRIKQLKALEQMRHVIFMDIGYSKVSLNLIQFTRFEGRLLDWQHLPFTGCKNMDHQLAQYYTQIFHKQTKQSIINTPKAFIKLSDAIQRQRTVLSANNQHHLSLQYLIGQQDLTYNLTRQQFQNIVVPVLADIAAAMAAIQSRNSSILIHSIELIGGASRIPCVQNMASKIFGIQPSRTLNQSEAVVMGSVIFGALQRKLLNLQYSFDTISTKDISVRWGKQKRDLFSKRTKYPAEISINVGNEGVVEMVLYTEQGVIQKEVGRLRLKTPNKVTFQIDQNRIMSVKIALFNLQLCDLHLKPEAKWKQIQQKQQEMSKVDLRMGMIYEMKNDYQSKYYWCQNKYQELKTIAAEEEKQQIQKHFKVASYWIEEEHSQHGSGSEKDLQQHSLKMNQIKELKRLCEAIEERRGKTDAIKIRYDRFTEQLAIAMEHKMSERGQKQIIQVMNWGEQAYQQMENHNWRTDQLTLQKLQQASILIKNAMKK